MTYAMNDLGIGKQKGNQANIAIVERHLVGDVARIGVEATDVIEIALRRAQRHLFRDEASDARHAEVGLQDLPEVAEDLEHGHQLAGAMDVGVTAKDLLEERRA